MPQTGDKREIPDSIIKRVPIDVEFKHETLYRTPRYQFGDGWCLTWAADDSQITAMDDGNWSGVDGVEDAWESSDFDRLWYPENGGVAFHSRLYRIFGETGHASHEEIKNFPHYRPSKAGNGSSWFTFGQLSVDGVLYSASSKTALHHWSTPFRGVKLLRSDDNGETWSRVAKDGSLRTLTDPLDPIRTSLDEKEMFFFEEYGQQHKKKIAYPFSWFDFVQQGRDHSAAPDDYVYIYSPEGARAHEAMLARVKKGTLGVRSTWEYFTGIQEDVPQWSSNIEDRRPAHVFPEHDSVGNYYGFTSWLPSVVWNKGLGLYIMVSGGTFAGPGMTDSDEDYFHSDPHTKSGSLGIYWSKNPWGPWTEIWYDEQWTVDSPNNHIYWPKVSPKWISESGEEMTLIWSDQTFIRDAEGNRVDGNFGITNYTWNQMKIRLVLGASK